jgi:hypothetical protein
MATQKKPAASSNRYPTSAKIKIIWSTCSTTTKLLGAHHCFAINSKQDSIVASYNPHCLQAAAKMAAGKASRWSYAAALGVTLLRAAPSPSCQLLSIKCSRSS